MMFQQEFMRSVAVCGVLSIALAAGACGGGEEPTPVPEVRSEALQQTAVPTTVSGCLRMGEATDTYVLTAARTAGGGEAATYQLVGVPNVNLRDHVGQQVQVSGTMEARQTASSQTIATPAATDGDGERAASGTAGAGEPTVRTQTSVVINRLSVDAVKPLGEECGSDM